MIKNSLNVALLALLTIGSAESSHATAVTYNFTATNFYGWNTLAPINSINGSYTLEGETLTAIDLTIGSHTYSLNEIAYQFLRSYPGYDVYLLGDTYNGVGGMTGRTNDFWLALKSTSAGMSFQSFTYAIPSINDTFESETGTLTVSPSTVPLPSSALLFSSCLLGAMGILRRRK